MVEHLSRVNAARADQLAAWEPSETPTEVTPYQMPDQPMRIRDREDADLDLCARALATVHDTSGYPTHWPADPVSWLVPSGTFRAWVATTSELPIAGHVALRQLPDAATGEHAAELSRLFVVPAARGQGIALALVQETVRWATANDLDLVLEVAEHLRAARTLYERAGFRLIEIGRADWPAPDGRPVTLYRYARSRHAS